MTDSQRVNTSRRQIRGHDNLHIGELASACGSLVRGGCSHGLGARKGGEHGGLAFLGRVPVQGDGSRVR
ncbi:hypothetical protein HYQ46_002625 [Verticillium longisporum]|nr:hypothetical protein HYQ46_002625 [Verticillium longisporum]